MILYKDIRTPGQMELFYKQVQSDPGVMLTKAEVTGVAVTEGGKLLISATDTLLGDNVAFEADLVVLATGLVPRHRGRAGHQPRTTARDRACRTWSCTTALPTPTSSASPMRPRRTAVYAAGCVHQPMTMAVAAEDGVGAAVQGHPGGGARGRGYGGAPPGLGRNLPGSLHAALHFL